MNEELEKSLASEAVAWNINSDEATALDYQLRFNRPPEFFDGTVPFRASDHCPIVVGLKLPSSSGKKGGSNGGKKGGSNGAKKGGSNGGKNEG